MKNSLVSKIRHGDSMVSTVVQLPDEPEHTKGSGDISTKEDGIEDDPGVMAKTTVSRFPRDAS